MSDEPARVTNWEALRDARTALGHLDVRVQTDFFGDVEGVDSVHLALKTLAPALARLFKGPQDGPAEDDIEDVVAFLVAGHRLAEDTEATLSDVLDGVKNATYQGLTTQKTEDLEKARKNLHGHLSELLARLESEEPRG